MPLIKKTQELQGVFEALLCVGETWSMNLSQPAAG